MNKTLAFMISDDFAFKAKKSGILEKIDRVNKLAILKYDDGTMDAIDLKDKLDKNSNMGFYIHQEFKLVYSEGEHFEAGDILAYNPSYFSGKGKDIDYHPGTLAKVAIASTDTSFEDSTIVSESLCKRCTSLINMLKQVALGKNAEIHSIVSIGDHVKTGDHLLDFTNSFDDPDTLEFLQKLADNIGDEDAGALSRDSVDSKYTGKITNVEIFYNCEFEELSPSLQKLIKKYKAELSNRTKALEGIKTSSVHIPPLEQVKTNKIGKAEFPDGGGVIINIWVEYEDTLSMGDKITYSTALKGVVSKVLKQGEAPVTEYRPEDPIEAVLTPTGIISRMTLDVYLMSFSAKCLVECGKQVREIWKGER